MIKDFFMKAFGKPGGLSCKQALAGLQSYLDGELDTDSAQEMVAHLDACEGCLGESEMYRSIQSSIKGAADPLDPKIINRLSEYASQIMDPDDD